MFYSAMDLFLLICACSVVHNVCISFFQTNVATKVKILNGISFAQVRESMQVDSR